MDARGIKNELAFQQPRSIGGVKLGKGRIGSDSHYVAQEHEQDD